MMVLALCLALAAAAQPPADLRDYEEMRKAVMELYRQEKFEEALRVLREAVDRYPERRMANRYNMALMCARLGRWEEAAGQLTKGHDQGVFYSKWGFGEAVWEPLRKLDSFAKVEARNNEMIREAERKSAMKWEVREPAGYDRSRPYPLFLALHGGGENLAEFKPQWTSKKLEGEFLTVYVQSSQVAAMNGYHWQGEETTRRDLAQA